MNVEKWGDITVQDRNTYKILLSTSSNRSMARLSSTMSRTAAAMPSSSRPITRANTTLGTSPNFSNVEFNVFSDIVLIWKWFIRTH